MTLFPDTQPLVSCIMPTYNRRFFVPKAIEYFLYQDYSNRELIIINDGTEPVNDLIPDNPHISCLYLDQRHSVGAKRNIACKNANGKIIIHWDDDDWMADWRISFQVKNLLTRQADICGLSRLFFFNPAANIGWEYINQDNKKPWVACGTLCYTKALWKQNPFPDINIGEGTRFVWNVPEAHITQLHDNHFYVAIVHNGNTSAKRTHDRYWHTVDIDRIQAILGEDYAFYAGLPE